MIACRAVRNFEFAFNHLRPAIAFSYLRCILNGWTTYQVMHNLPEFSGCNRCVFGCLSAEDSMKHYWCCQYVKDAFLLSAPGLRWDGLPASFFVLDGACNDQQRSSRLRFLYAVYMAYNKIRQLPANSCNPVALIKEFFQLSRWSN